MDNVVSIQGEAIGNGPESDLGTPNAVAEATREEERPIHPNLAPHVWKPGQSGNPAGRPKGSRNQLGEQFIADLHKIWNEDGEDGKPRGLAAIRAAMKDKPADALKVIASILPRDIKLSLETMSDGELSRKIDNLTQSLGIELTPRTIDITPETAETKDKDPL